jgi:hypothetical protein
MNPLVALPWAGFVLGSVSLLVYGFVSRKEESQRHLELSYDLNAASLEAMLNVEWQKVIKFYETLERRGEYDETYLPVFVTLKSEIEIMQTLLRNTSVLREAIEKMEASRTKKHDTPAASAAG